MKKTTSFHLMMFLWWLKSIIEELGSVSRSIASYLHKRSYEYSSTLCSCGEGEIITSREPKYRKNN